MNYIGAVLYQTKATNILARDFGIRIIDLKRRGPEHVAFSQLCAQNHEDKVPTYMTAVTYSLAWGGLGRAPRDIMELATVARDRITERPA